MTATSTATLNAWVWPASHIPSWSEHPNAGNYLAILTPDKTAPSGFARDWLVKAKGTPGFVMRRVTVGDTLEGGCNRVDSKGTVSKQRVWLSVIDCNRDNFTYQVWPDVSTAYAQAKATKQEAYSTTSVPALQRRRRDLLDALAKLNDELKGVDEDIKALVKSNVEDSGLVMSDDNAEQITEEITEQVLPPVVKNLNEHVRTLLAAPQNPSQDDDDDEELTPAQKRALGVPV